MNHDELHIIARKCAERLSDADKKQLRFNDIVRVAQDYYNDPREGIRELVRACDRNDALYDKVPMWQSLEQNYGWMK